MPAGPVVAAPSTLVAPSVPSSVTMPDGRAAQLINLGAPGGDVLLHRIATELPGAAAAVTAFWGPQWPREVLVAVAGTQNQFATLAGGGTGVAATTTADRIMFAPGATAMNDADLRTVLRHELFHYAARADTAADAPTWLTEGVADFVGRPVSATPAESSRQLPTDAELAAAGRERSAAYDRAWSFATYVADTYGVDGLRALYLRACGHGHLDVATAVRDALGVELPVVLAGWRNS